MSVLLPGAAGMTTRMGLDGNGCACAHAAINNSAAAQARGAVPILPFKGRTEVGHLIPRSAYFFLPFKGRTEVGMGW